MYGITVQGAIAGGGVGAPAPVPSSFSTDFDGPDANPIGAPFASWAPPGGGNIQRVGNQAAGSAAGQRNTVSLSGVVPPNLAFAEATVGALGVGGGLMAGPILGIDLATNVGWFFAIDDAGLVYMTRFAAGAFLDVLVPIARAHTPGDLYRIEMNRTTKALRGLVNGLEVMNGVDGSAFVPGFGSGLLVRNTDCIIETFSVGAA